MIYQAINGQIVPYINKSGKRFKPNTRQAKHVRSKRSQRTHKYFKFYESTAWKNKSKAIRQAEPLCRACVKERNKGERPIYKVHLSESVDHIVPLKEDWSKRLDDNNLQPLCHYHHILKSKRGK